MELYEYDTMRSVEDTYWWYTGMHKLIAKIPSESPDKLPRMKVLDAGCGTGGMMAKLHNVLPQVQLTGIDFSASAVEFTQQRQIGTVKQASVENLPFP
jgi:ubiquinone/menaquinone biosynthesis C-methylase UbiE